MGVLVKRGICYTGSGDILNQPVIYSDSERCIGVWRDGKPLYQKTVKLTLTSTNTSIPLSNVDTFVKIEGFGYSEGDAFVCFPYYISASYFYLGYYDISDNSVHIQCGGETLRYYSDFTATLQYTKTTDTAGTGPWAPTGATPIHYSLEEQCIGTWIDGKPLYQKSFQFLNHRLENGNNAIANLSSLNYDVICDIDAVITNSVHDTYRKANIYFNDIDKDVNIVIESDKTLVIVVWTTWSSPNIYITLKYTKTTD